jgi:hypothetical protein
MGIPGNEKKIGWKILEKKFLSLE